MTNEQEVAGVRGPANAPTEKARRVGRVPNVFDEDEQKLIASYLGITPEAVQAVGWLAWMKDR